MSANEKPRVDLTGESISPLIVESLRAGLAVLWRAYLCAHDSGANVWDFAIRSRQLCEAGMTSSDLRWMIAKAFAEHGHETSAYDDPHRSFRRSNGYFFNEHSCLVLTPRGAALAEVLFRETVHAPQATVSVFAAVAGRTASLTNLPQPTYETSMQVKQATKPRWDGTRRELTFGGLIVKRFRVPARNQETILSVFEEEGWTEHIHDPLSVDHDIDAPTRLHDAINRLNRCQINPLLRFHGDGKGTGIFWESSQRDRLR